MKMCIKKGSVTYIKMQPMKHIFDMYVISWLIISQAVKRTQSLSTLDLHKLVSILNMLIKSLGDSHNDFSLYRKIPLKTVNKIISFLHFYSLVNPNNFSFLEQRRKRFNPNSQTSSNHQQSLFY